MKILNYKEFIFKNKINEDVESKLDQIENTDQESVEKTITDHNTHASAIKSIFTNINKTDDQILKELAQKLKNWYPKQQNSPSNIIGLDMTIKKGVDSWGSLVFPNRLDKILFTQLKNERDLKLKEQEITNREEAISKESSNKENSTKEISTGRVQQESEEINKLDIEIEEIKKSITSAKSEFARAKSEILRQVQKNKKLTTKTTTQDQVESTEPKK